MPRKSGLQIEKEILHTLREGELSLRELETRLNTNYNTIRAHCRVLEFYGFLKFTEHSRSEANGRAYTTVKLTVQGSEFISLKARK